MAKPRVETEDNLREIKEKFYCVDGILYYKKKTRKKHIGDIAGHVNKANRYININLFATIYQVHKIIYYLHHNVWPDYIDHINGVRDDNRIENLRVSSPKHNSRSARSPTKGATSRYRGVSRYKRHSKWQAMVCVNNKRIFLGYFTCEKKAALAYNKAATRFGFSKEALNKVED